MSWMMFSGVIMNEVLRKSPTVHRCRMGPIHRFKMLRIFSSFAPTAAAPKVFMKYFFVNTKTGEKSGEMMVIARL